LCCTGQAGSGPLRDQAAALEVLRHSRDPDALERAATQLCRAGSLASLRRLAERLADPGLATRLDGEQAYRDYVGYYMTPLRLNRILLRLGKAGSRAAEQALLRLVADKQFMAHRARVDGLSTSAKDF